jgi:hypothetical protein
MGSRLPQSTFFCSFWVTQQPKGTATHGDPHLFCSLWLGSEQKEQERDEGGTRSSPCGATIPASDRIAEFRQSWLRQLAPDHVAEDVDYLLGRAGGGLGGAVDLL